MSKKPKKLSSKLSRTLVLLAFPIFVISTGSFFLHSQELIREECVERSSNILNTTKLRVVNFLNTIETAAKSNVWMLEEHFEPDSLQAVTNRIVRLNSGVISCSVSAEPDVFPEFGRYFSVYSVREGDTVVTVRESDFEYYDRMWYKTALQTGKASWVTPFSDFMEGHINYKDAIASYCIPLRPQRGRISGVVSVDFSFESLANEVVSNQHPYPSSYYMLIGSDGRYLIHPETSLLFKKTIFSDADAVKDADMMALGREMTAGKEGITHVKIGDKNYHVCYTPVPGTSWSLALVSPEDEVLAEYQHLAYYIIGVIIIGLLLIWWLAYRVVRHNIKPIKELLEITNKIAEGDYDVKIPESNRKDTISQMQNGFILMRRSIVAHREQVNHTLETLKQENEKLEVAMKQAEKAVKRKEIFVNSVMRQIQKPINVVEGLTTVLRRGLVARDAGKPVQTEELNHITDSMRFNATSLHRMTLMLYDSSDTRAADDTAYARTDMVPCNEIAKECVERTQEIFQHAVIRFESELPDSLCIRTNRHHLRLTLRELLYNAAKYSDGQHVVLRLTRAENTIHFTIEDVGPGIPAEALDFIFLPFMKVENLSDGLGLGLPLCKRHITRLGGDVFYDTSYQEGCRIVVELPK